uniref:Conserved oligomeric Golgi complex subunit 6 n=1 Tax=Cyanistes caeruleus TaxID=156563 RepID=A0A8C0UB79_CYACU
GGGGTRWGPDEPSGAAGPDRLRGGGASPAVPSVPLRSCGRPFEMLEALKALSTFFVENSLRTRRNLRGDIERRSLAINEEFVHIFKQVKEELESINEDVQAMSSCCEDMSSRLKAAKEQTQDLIVKTTKLQAENQRLEMKAQVADAFIAKFQLTPDEMNLLRGTKDEPITEDFFKALRRVKQIHDDVKILLRTNQQRAGLEIMEQMALLQETSYERLYRWTQNECRTLTQESCDISPVLAQAMEALQDRPVLYNTSCHSWELQSFLAFSPHLL